VGTFTVVEETPSAVEVYSRDGAEVFRADAEWSPRLRGLRVVLTQMFVDDLAEWRAFAPRLGVQFLGHVIVQRDRQLPCHRSMLGQGRIRRKKRGEVAMSEYEKPSKNEDEYFARQELERRKKWASEQGAKMEAEHKEQLKQLHWMKCPKCGMDLKEIELHGVKVDQCASCGGVFLDAGEMDQVAGHEEGGLMGRVFSLFR
jgi:Zn-finger nucleic acid-binding protein